MLAGYVPAQEFPFDGDATHRTRNFAQWGLALLVKPNQHGAAPGGPGPVIRGWSRNINPGGLEGFSRYVYVTTPLTGGAGGLASLAGIVGHSPTPALRLASSATEAAPKMATSNRSSADGTGHREHTTARVS